MDRDEVLSRMSEDVRDRIDSVMEMYRAPFARLIGIEIESLEADRAVCSLDLRPELLNSMGRGHGGAVYALMDHTFAILCNMNRPCTGQCTSISYYRPASGRITAVAVPINRSRSLEHYDVKAYSEEGKLVASATCTAFVLKGRPHVETLPLLRRAGAVQQRHLPQVLQEDPGRAADGSAPRPGG